MYNNPLGRSTPTYYYYRFPAWSCPMKRAVYSTPDSQCLECYIIYRLSILHTMQKIGIWEWVVI